MALASAGGIVATDIAHLGPTYVVGNEATLTLARKSDNRFLGRLAALGTANSARALDDAADVITAVDADSTFVVAAGDRRGTAFVTIVDYNPVTQQFSGANQTQTINNAVVHDVDASGGLVAVATSRGLAIYTKDGSRFLNRDLLGDRDCRDVEIAAGLIYCASEAGLIEVFDLNSSFRADHIAELVGSEVLPGEHIALDRGVAWVTSGDVLTALELGATASMSLVRSASGEMGDMSLEGASVLASTATEILSSFTYPINPTSPVSISVSLPSPPLVKHWGKTMMVIAHPGSGSSAFALAPNRVATTATSVARPAVCPAPFVVSDMRVDGDILYLVGSTGAEVWNLGPEAELACSPRRVLVGPPALV
jgi:hypothetical protein